MVWVGELSAQYSTAWHTTLSKLLVKVVIVLPMVGFFGNCFGYFTSDLGGRHLVVFASPF